MNIKLLTPNAIPPRYEHEGDSGLSLFSIEDKLLLPLVPCLVRTGIAIELPPGLEAQVRPRSGLALNHGLFIVNSPGTIDSNYRGEVGVVMTSLFKEYQVKEGDKIAQLVIAKVNQEEVFIVVDISNTTRNEAGFGSTGR